MDDLNPQQNSSVETFAFPKTYRMTDMLGYARLFVFVACLAFVGYLPYLFIGPIFWVYFGVAVVIIIIAKIISYHRSSILLAEDSITINNKIVIPYSSISTLSGVVSFLAFEKWQPMYGRYDISINGKYRISTSKYGLSATKEIAMVLKSKCPNALTNSGFDGKATEQLSPYR
jgi:hypothetical protein